MSGKEPDKQAVSEQDKESHEVSGFPHPPAILTGMYVDGRPWEVSPT